MECDSAQDKVLVRVLPLKILYFNQHPATGVFFAGRVAHRLLGLLGQCQKLSALRRICFQVAEHG
jgi:hypothetical protein